jgi:hypothetical protein
MGLALFLALYAARHGNLTVLWQPAEVLLCAGLAWLARGIGGWDALVPLGRRAGRHPVLRLERARLSVRTLPHALGAYALMTAATLLFADLREPPEVLGHVGGAEIVGAIYLAWAFLLGLARVQALEARERALGPGHPPAARAAPSLAGPTGAMLGIMAALLLFNALFLDACLVGAHEGGRVVTFFGELLPATWDYLTWETMGEGARRVLFDALIPSVVLAAGLWNGTLWIARGRAFPHWKAAARALGHCTLAALAVFGPVAGVLAYGRMATQYYAPVFACLALLLGAGAGCAALGSRILREPGGSAGPAVRTEAGMTAEDNQRPDPSQARDSSDPPRAEDSRPARMGQDPSPALLGSPPLASSRATALAWAALPLALLVLGIVLERPWEIWFPG